MPEPLIPTIPIRSPGPTRQVTWSSSVAFGAVDRGHGRRHVRQLQHVLAEPAAGKGVQLHGVPWLRHAGDDRLGGLDAVPGLDVRAGGPAAQPGQLLAGQIPSPFLRGLVQPQPFGPGEHPVRVAALADEHGSVDHLPGRGCDRVQEPAVVGDRHHRARPCAQVSASQATASMSRWLVGSSSSTRSASVTSAAPSATRRCSPPDSCRRRSPARCPAAPARQHGADRGVRGPGVLGVRRRCAAPPPGRSRRRAGRSSARRRRPWSRPAMDTRPVSGLSQPGQHRSRVVLPEPLRPRTPIRSPVCTPSDTRSSTVCDHRAVTLAASMFTRFGHQRLAPGGVPTTLAPGAGP